MPVCECYTLPASFSPSPSVEADGGLPHAADYSVCPVYYEPERSAFQQEQSRMHRQPRRRYEKQMQLEPGRQAGPGPTPRPRQPIGRKKGTACSRCRLQKTRCDDSQPCRNCSKVGHDCVRPGLHGNPEANEHIHQRLRALEHSLRRVAPQELDSLDEVLIANPLDTGPLAEAPGSLHSIPEPSSPLRRSPDEAIDEALCLPQSHEDPLPPNSVFEVAPAASHRDPSPRGSNAGTVHTNARTLRSTGTDINTAETESPGRSTQIKPSEPLAHDVGLLSLSNANEPRYLGPSSGVPFARLILSAIPQSQGLATSLATSGSPALHKSVRPEPFPQDWRFEVDLEHFVTAYFEVYQPLYPFLDEDAVITRLDAVLSTQSSPTPSIQRPCLADFEGTMLTSQAVQLLLVIALGARIMEARLSVDFSSENYMATAMSRIDKLSLHESVEGVQIMILLTLCSFCFADGPNAWFLTSNIIATCLDLGLQRRLTGNEVEHSLEGCGGLLAHANVRRGIFWSAYSLERTLAVVLGRPLTLRDEAIDVEFPGVEDLEMARAEEESAEPTQDHSQQPYHRAKRRRAMSSPFVAAEYSFRFDQLTAEMKLMLYRVNNKPERFPWIANTAEWQEDAHQRCKSLAEQMLNDLKWRSRRGTSDSIVQQLELKYYHCLMLLHRPSPATPRPSLTSWHTCYSSAVRTVLISADLLRFSKLSNSWLTAHTIFVSGITYLYCLWAKPEIQKGTSLESYQNTTSACVTVLRFLGKTWSVAADALIKFERLIHLTTSSWRAGPAGHSEEEMVAGHSLMTMNGRAQGWSEDASTVPVEASNPHPTDCWAPQGSEYGPEFQSFFSELGDMSTWFDLNWMSSADQGGMDLYNAL